MNYKNLQSFLLNIPYEEVNPYQSIAMVVVLDGICFVFKCLKNVCMYVCVLIGGMIGEYLLWTEVLYYSRMMTILSYSLLYIDKINIE